MPCGRRDRKLARGAARVGRSRHGRVFEERASGTQRDRPQLKAGVDYVRAGDTLVVRKLDRLARSIKQLIETVEAMEGHGIGFRSLTEAIDNTVYLGSGHGAYGITRIAIRRREARNVYAHMRSLISLCSSPSAFA